MINRFGARHRGSETDERLSFYAAEFQEVPEPGSVAATLVDGGLEWEQIPGIRLGMTPKTIDTVNDQIFRYNELVVTN